MPRLKVVFHGANAATFRDGIEAGLEQPHEIAVVPDQLSSAGDRATYAAADIIVGTRLAAGMPVAPSLKLYQVPGAGYDGIDLSALSAGAMLCNCFGHENAIAEFVIAALLARHVPLADADRRLRAGDWKYWAGGPGPRAAGPRTELGETSLGILGYGHIGKTLALRAKAFGMQVTVANRSPVAVSDVVDNFFSISELAAFMGSADAVVNTLPLTNETRGLIGNSALAGMRPQAVIINVGRGAVIDEAALYEALRSRRIGGAVIDTWYRYPSADDPGPSPSRLPFHELDNVVMTPHMSGWTHGTIRRRHKAIAANINAVAAGREPANRIR